MIVLSFFLLFLPLFPYFKAHPPSSFMVAVSLLLGLELMSFFSLIPANVFFQIIIHSACSLTPDPYACFQYDRHLVPPISSINNGGYGALAAYHCPRTTYIPIGKDELIFIPPVWFFPFIDCVVFVTKFVCMYQHSGPEKILRWCPYQTVFIFSAFSLHCAGMIRRITCQMPSTTPCLA